MKPRAPSRDLPLSCLTQDRLTPFIRKYRYLSRASALTRADDVRHDSLVRAREKGRSLKHRSKFPTYFPFFVVERRCTFTSFLRAFFHLQAHPAHSEASRRARHPPDYIYLCTVHEGPLVVGFRSHPGSSRMDRFPRRFPTKRLFFFSV